jgi:hypothetical protein
MTATDQKSALERDFLKWARETLPSDQKQFLSVFHAGYLAGMAAALKILREGVHDPYDWKIKP